MIAGPAGRISQAYYEPNNKLNVLRLVRRFSQPALAPITVSFLLRARERGPLLTPVRDKAHCGFVGFECEIDQLPLIRWLNGGDDSKLRQVDDKDFGLV